MNVPGHVEAYLQGLRAQGRPEPAVLPALDRGARDRQPLDLLYRADDEVWVHVHTEGGTTVYHPVAPILDDEAKTVLQDAHDSLFERVANEALPSGKAEASAILDAAVDKAAAKASPAARLSARYHLRAQVLGGKALEALMRDFWIEDINGVGLGHAWLVHKVFGGCRTTIQFASQRDLDAFLVGLSEGMGRPVSEARPIVDGALPDGSRINIVYGNLSPGGSSFTIRKFGDQPTPITQLVAWGTMDSRIAAYLWLCMETGMSVFVSGETASGKTTTLNAMLPLVPGNMKVLTAEDTPEVRPPHGNWQQLLTREAGEAARVHMGDLLKVGLRSRPDRMVVGEIRGVEGAVAFQAMQTGYPTMATFHASSVTKLIQRMTSEPIKVPAQFMPNLQVVLVQLAVHVGGRRLRRVIEVEEIESFSRRAGIPVTRQVFNWDPVKDTHRFNGRNNSYVLESLVAPRLGLDNRAIYGELERRAAVIEGLVRQGRFDYHDTTAFFQRGAQPALAPSGPAVPA